MQFDSREKDAEFKQDARIYQDSVVQFTAERRGETIPIGFQLSADAEAFVDWAEGRRPTPPEPALQLLSAAGFIAAPIEASLFPGGYLDRHARTLRYLGSYESSSASASDMLKRLYTSQVTLIGLGGVGSWIAGSLLMMGVGRVIGVDGDCVGWSNLNRTYLYRPDDVGRLKTGAFADFAANCFPDQEFVGVPRWISGPDDVADVALGSSFVVSAADTPHRTIREWVRQGSEAVNAKVIETMGGRIGPIRGQGAVPYGQAPVLPGAWRKSLSAEARGPGVPVFHPMADATGICQALFCELTGSEEALLRRGFIRKSATVNVGTFCAMEEVPR